MNEEYYKHENLSQSDLKRYINPNPRSLHRRRSEDELYYQDPSIHFSKGSLLDRLLEGLEIDEYYYIESKEYKRSTSKVISIAQECIDLDLDIEDYEEILKIKEKQKYQPRWKEEKNLTWINDVLLPTIKNRKAAEGKIILTHEEFVQVATMANSMLHGEYTQPILNELPGTHQVAIYIDGLKCLIDYFQICHDTKVMRIIDYKSTGDYIERFPKSIKRWGYDIQLSFYGHIAKLKYPDYKLLDPILIVGSTKEPNWAEPFTLSPLIVKNAKEGWIDKYGRKLMGWKEMLIKCNNYNQEMYNADLIKHKTNIINEL